MLFLFYVFEKVPTRGCIISRARTLLGADEASSWSGSVPDRRGDEIAPENAAENWMSASGRALASMDREGMCVQRGEIAHMCNRAAAFTRKAVRNLRVSRL